MLPFDVYDLGCIYVYPKCCSAHEIDAGCYALIAPKSIFLAYSQIAETYQLVVNTTFILVNRICV